MIQLLKENGIIEFLLAKAKLKLITIQIFLIWLILMEQINHGKNMIIQAGQKHNVVKILNHFWTFIDQLD